MYKKLNTRKTVLVSSKEVELSAKNLDSHFYFSKDDGKTYTIISVAFCPYCKKMEPIYKFFKPLEDKEEILKKMEKDDEYFFFSYDFEYRKASSFYEKIHKNAYSSSCYVAKCPNCGHNLARNPVEEISISDKEKRNARLFGYDVYKKENKIIIRSIFKYFTPNTYLEKIFVSFFDIYVSINLQTGQTFIMAPLKNGKTVRWMKRKLLNITYSFYYIPFIHLYEQIFNNKRIIKAVAEILYDEKNIKFDSNVNFRDLILLNRFPYFNISFVRDLIKYLDFWQSNRFVRKLCANIKVNERYDINETIKRFRIPNKPKIRRLVTQNPINLFRFAIAKKVGFSNYDLLVRIVEQFYPSLKFFPYSDSQVPNFIKTLIKEKGEVNAFSCIFSFYDYDYDDIFYVIDDLDLFGYLKDVAQMYDMLVAANIPIDFSGDIINIHDRFSNEMKKINSKNIDIKYDEKELALEDSINNIQFLLPKDTYQLIDVGRHLHICVGSYGKKAVTKNCTIVLMIKNNEYIGCIELCNDKLIQAKAVCNNLLQEKKAETLKIWVDNHKINANDCFDYNHIKNNKIIYDTDKIYQGKIRYDNL